MCHPRKIKKLLTYLLTYLLTFTFRKVLEPKTFHSFPVSLHQILSLSCIYIHESPYLIARRWVGRQASDGPDLKLFILVGWGRSFLSIAWPTGVQLMFFFCFGVSKLFGAQGSPSSGSLLNL